MAGPVVLRAELTLYLTSLAPTIRLVDGLDGVLRRELTVDLFDLPQRARYRERVIAMRAGGKTEREVGQALGITQTAAQRAAALDRRMKELGITDPYLRVHEPPADYGKLRRHRHSRYRFDPL